MPVWGRRRSRRWWDQAPLVTLCCRTVASRGTSVQEPLVPPRHAQAPRTASGSLHPHWAHEAVEAREDEMTQPSTVKSTRQGRTRWKQGKALCPKPTVLPHAVN